MRFLHYLLGGLLFIILFILKVVLIDQKPVTLQINYLIELGIMAFIAIMAFAIIDYFFKRNS